MLDIKISQILHLNSKIVPVRFCITNVMLLDKKQANNEEVKYTPTPPRPASFKVPTVVKIVSKV